jgi:hypothetical protein
MNIISKNTIKKHLSVMIFIAIIVKISMISVAFILPQKSIEANLNKSFKPQYISYDFSNMIESAKNNNNRFTNVVNNINHIKLKGIYRKANNGFIILNIPRTSKTHILSIGDYFDKYQLIEIQKNQVLFQKESKIFKVEIDGLKKDKKDGV